MSIYTKKLLKGGSLASTHLLEDSSGHRRVRKEISVRANREYGYQRWYSQMKRMQRYESLFPGLFPKLLECGYQSENSSAYFDMEFLDGAENCHEYICATESSGEVEKVFDQVLLAMAEIHSVEMKTSTPALDLYIEEEITHKLEDCMGDIEFKQFFRYSSLIFNDTRVPSLSSMMDAYIEKGRRLYSNPTECFTHGNITLENMMYDRAKDRIYLIDPYEENIIDSIYNEYSQILQSSNSYYEIYNTASVMRGTNTITCSIDVPGSLKYFNQLFEKHMQESLTPEDIQMVKFFEISQFIRMLPFKLHVAKEKMFLFYTIASVLTNRFLHGDSA